MLVDERELEARDDLCDKKSLILADSSYNVRRDQNDGHSDNNVFRSSYIKDVSSVLGDAMNPKALLHVCCFALQFPLCCKVPALKRRKCQSVAGRISKSFVPREKQERCRVTVGLWDGKFSIALFSCYWKLSASNSLKTCTAYLRGRDGRSRWVIRSVMGRALRTDRLRRTHGDFLQVTRG